MGKCAWRDANVCSILWHTEGWSPRDEAILEAVLKRARTTKHPWLIACDAKMSPEDFEKKACGFGKIECMYWHQKVCQRADEKKQRRMG